MKSRYLNLGRTLAAAAVVGGLAACATPKPLVPLNPNTPNSVVLSNGERVCDVSGDWEGVYDNFNAGINKEVVNFTRDGFKFIGKKERGNEYIEKGRETIKGKLKFNGFEEIYMNARDAGWIPSSGELSESCSKIIIDNYLTKITLKIK